MVNQQGREGDHSPTSSVEVKCMLCCTYTPPYKFMACSTQFKYNSFLYHDLTMVLTVVINLGRNNSDESHTWA
jgi:hypothetical protein